MMIPLFALLALSASSLSHHTSPCTLDASSAAVIIVTSAVESAQTPDAQAQTSALDPGAASASSTGLPVAVGTSASSDNGHKLAVPLGISLGVLMLMIIGLLVWFCLRRCRRKRLSLQHEGVMDRSAFGALEKSVPVAPFRDPNILSCGCVQRAETVPGPHSEGPLFISMADGQSVGTEASGLSIFPVSQLEINRQESASEGGWEVHASHSSIASEGLSPRPTETGLTLAVLPAHLSEGQDAEFHPEVRKLLEEGTLTKQALGSMEPMKPKNELVNPGYNPRLDEKRPKSIRQYLRDYRILFVIDDSGSMSGKPWGETRDALFQIAEYALKFHVRSVDIRFFNDIRQERGVQGGARVVQIFNQVSPSNGTPTGAVLKNVLDEQINRLDAALLSGAYSSEPPLDIIVITDGVPNTDSPPAPVIEVAARQMKERGHHQNAIGIQFVQIGNCPQAEPTLLSLIHGNNNDMVDTVGYSVYKDEGGGKLTAAVLERIVLGGLHPSLRAYYNQYELRRSGNDVGGGSALP